MTISLTSQLVDENLDPGSPSQFGTANAQQSETVINLQGANCSAMGHSGTVGTASPVTADSQAANSNFRGMYVPVTIARDHNHLHFWVRDLYPVRNKSIGGVSVYIANGTTGEALYYLTGIDDGYLGDWYHGVVNLSTTDRAAADLGTLPTGNLDRVGYAGNISASKGEDFLQNSYLDAIRHGADGVGNTFTGGTSMAPDDLEACALADTASYGLFRLVGGALRIEGPLTWGLAATDTYITDSLRTINFASFTTGDGTTAAVAQDFYRLVFADGTTSVTVIDLTDITWNGVSRNIPFRFTVNMGAGDSYASLRSTYIFGETITFNTLYTSDGDRFVECQTIVPGSITLTDPNFTNCDAVTLTAASDLISGGVTNLHNTASGVAFITTNSLNKIENHVADNTGGVGHFVEITAIGTYDWDGNLTTGYTGTGNNATIYNNSGGLVTINVINGADTPTIRNGASASTVVNATVTLKVTAVESTDQAVIAGATVYLQAANGTGPLPFEESVTITQAAGTATVSHTAHTLATGAKVKIKGASPSEYNGIKTITVVNGNSYTFPIASGTSSPATGTIVSTAVILDGITDALGVVQDTGFNFGASQPVAGFVRQGTFEPTYITSNLGGSIESGGYVRVAAMVRDG